MSRTANREATSRRGDALKAFHVMPPPVGCERMPRPGSLKSAALFVLYTTGATLSTRQIGRLVKDVTWAPRVWSEQRLATVLGQMADADKLIDRGEPTPRPDGEDGGPLLRKTWRWRLS